MCESSRQSRKIDKIVSLDYSMHYQIQCANLKVVIPKKSLLE